MSLTATAKGGRTGWPRGGVGQVDRQSNSLEMVFEGISLKDCQPLTGTESGPRSMWAMREFI